MFSAALAALLWWPIIALTVSPPDTQNVFHYTSESGDFDGKGEERTISSLEGYSFALSRSTPSAVGFYITGQSAKGGGSYNVDFGAPKGAKLKVGDYPEAMRYPFQTGRSPGLNFDANGSGSNALTGQFQILEIRFDEDGTLAAFAANFVQHGEGRAAASYGQIRYHSSLPYLTPAGAVQLALGKYRVLAGAGQLVIIATRRDGSRGPLSVDYSTADNTDFAGRDYTATAGTLTWADGDSANKTFTIPILNSGDPTQGDGTFFVRLSGAGTGAQSQATVTVVNDNSAVTFVHFASEPGDYIGQGKERTFNLLDGFVVTASRTGGGVSISFDDRIAAGSGHAEDWHLQFAAPAGTVFGVGDYENAVRAPTRDSGEAMLDVFGDGRGPSPSKGSFRVREAQFDHDGSVLKFAADFELYNKGDHGLSLRGQARYNSTVPLPPPPTPAPTPTPEAAPAATPMDAASPAPSTEPAHNHPKRKHRHAADDA